jgi:hypothetical protein
MLTFAVWEEKIQALLNIAVFSQLSYNLFTFTYAQDFKRKFQMIMMIGKKRKNMTNNQVLVAHRNFL